MIPPHQGWQSYHDIALQPHNYIQPPPAPMPGLYPDYYMPDNAPVDSHKRALEELVGEGHAPKRIHLEQGSLGSVDLSRMEGITTTIASLYTVVSQLEETTREVVTLSQQRHTKYQEETEALKAENAHLQAQLDETKQRKFDLTATLQDILHPAQPQDADATDADPRSSSLAKGEKISQRYDELAAFASQALHQNREILDELQTTRDARDRLQREFERERAAANRARRATEDNESLRANIAALRAEYDSFKQLASADKLIDLAQQNYNTVLRERDRLLVDKTRLGVEMDKVTSERDRLRTELLRAERDGYLKRHVPPEPMLIDHTADTRNQRYWSRFKEGWEKGPERGQSRGSHSSAWVPVYTT